MGDHAGLKALPLLSPIDSTSCSETRTQPLLLLMLKSLSTAEPVDHAKEETQVVSTNSPTKKVSQIPHASNTLPTILKPADAVPSTSARTAPGHHAQSTRLAKINAGLSTTSTTMPLTTTALEVPTR